MTRRGKTIDYTYAHLVVGGEYIPVSKKMALRLGVALLDWAMKGRV